MVAERAFLRQSVMKFESVSPEELSRLTNSQFLEHLELLEHTMIVAEIKRRFPTIDGESGALLTGGNDEEVGKTNPKEQGSRRLTETAHESTFKAKAIVMSLFQEVPLMLVLLSVALSVRNVRIGLFISAGWYAVPSDVTISRA